MINTNTKINKTNNNIYLDLWKEVKSRDYNKFYRELEKDFNIKIDNEIQEFIHNLALTTQITIKRSRMLYLHGFVLYSSLLNYLKSDKSNISDKSNKPISILETGTARGFSSLVMAKAIDVYLNTMETELMPSDMPKIYTIDIISPDEVQEWNCYGNPRKTLLELLEPYNYLKKYIEFLTGDSKIKIDELKSNLKRENREINYAFLDAHHSYEALKPELDKVKSTADVIICDDYTIYNKPLIVRNPKNNTLQRKLNYQYPGIIIAIEEFKNENKNFKSKIYWGEDGEKRRGYVYFQKKELKNKN